MVWRQPVWAFAQKSAAYMINFQIIAFLTMGSIVIPDLVFHQELLQMPLALAVGLVLLYLGHRKLSTME